MIAFIVIIFLCVWFVLRDIVIIKKKKKEEIHFPNCHNEQRNPKTEISISRPCFSLFSFIKIVWMELTVLYVRFYHRFALWAANDHSPWKRHHCLVNFCDEILSLVTMPMLQPHNNNFFFRLLLHLISVTLLISRSLFHLQSVAVCLSVSVCGCCSAIVTLHHVFSCCKLYDYFSSR